MQLVMFAQDFPPTTGGIQTYAAQLAMRFAKRAEQFSVVAPATKGASAFDRHFPCPVVRVRGSNDAFAAHVVPELLRSRHAVTFHTQWPSALAAVGLQSAGFPLDVVVAAHGRELLLSPLSRFPLAARTYDAARRCAFARAKRVFAVSRFTADLVHALGVSKERVFVQGNGTDPDMFRPRPSESFRASLAVGNEFTFLTVARLVKRKSVDVVLRAFALLDRSATRLWVVGEGPERQRLESLARDLGIGPRVHFAGRVAADELPNWYAAADAFVLPARSEPPDVEGFGIAFLEASASELPVIGPNTGGPLDAIEPGVTGYVVDPKDAADLASHMGRLAANPEAARALGRAGRSRVISSHSWDHVADKLYAELELLRGAR